MLDAHWRPNAKMSKLQTGAVEHRPSASHAGRMDTCRGECTNAAIDNISPAETFKSRVSVLDAFGNCFPHDCSSSEATHAGKASVESIKILANAHRCDRLLRSSKASSI